MVELTHTADLSVWPAGRRLIVRKERPQPGVQLRITDRGRAPEHHVRDEHALREAGTTSPSTRSL